MSALIKFGIPGIENLVDPYHHPNTWTREQTGRVERLIIAPSSHHIDLMMRLLDCMQGPFGILYVLTVSRRDHDQGRYQSKQPFEKPILLSFLEEFREYFEQDGRHHLWAFGIGDKSQIVYDKHNIIFAYGPLDDFEHVLGQEGLTRDNFDYPAPHVHLYHEEFDDAEDRILSEFEWKLFPLQEQDDD